MPTQTKAPTSVSQFARDVAWSNPNNVTANDGAVASASLTSGLSSYALVPQTFGFTVPSGARITDVELTVRIRGVGGVSPSDLTLLAALTTDGTDVGTVGSPNFFSITTSWQTLVLNGFSASLTSSEVNASGFGVAILASLQIGAPAVVVEIDWGTITVYFNESSPVILFLS